MHNTASFYKKILFQQCVEYVNDRIRTAEQAMNNAQAAANEEGKSSAGDKYETGRAMMQIERDKAAQQLNEALKLKEMLANIKSNVAPNRVEPGCIVFTEEVNFYISLSAGKIMAEGIEFIAIAPNAPIAIVLMNLVKGDSFPFNKKIHVIEKIA